MARSYASIVTAIWRDTDFCALTAGAQRTYLMLISQPDISAAGVLAYRVRRWASTLIESERGQLPIWLSELESRQYIIIDETTDELLVRSFLRWDRGHSNPKRQPVIRDAMADIMSSRVASELLLECTRVGFDPMDAFSQVNTLSDSLSPKSGMPISENRSEDRVVVTKVGSTPQPTIRKPQPALLSAGATASDEADPWLFTEFCSAYPKRVYVNETRPYWRRACRKHHPDEIVRAARRYATDPNLPPERFIPEAKTWLERESWNDEALPARGSESKTPTTTTRVQAGLALVAELEAEES